MRKVSVGPITPREKIPTNPADRRMALAAAIIAKKWPLAWELLGLDSGRCQSCGAGIWWIVTPKGARMPVSSKGVSHFADCPNADSHRGRR